MSSSCRQCAAGLDHCHGTVVHHVRSRPECTEDGCESPESPHSFSVDCEAVGCSCGRAVAVAV
ncbi:MAG: hypothetical protein JST91_10695 [Actinobacteria bacterium]|nr:hypothetical protein [Actinomycetota bacterium]